MATSRIPGPFSERSNLLLSREREEAWKPSSGQEHRFHIPGPIAMGDPFGWATPRILTPVRSDLNMEALYQDLLKQEDFIPFMYLDTKNRVTVGVGNMLPDVTAAQKLPFVDTTTGNPATPTEIERAYDGVSRLPFGLAAQKYKLRPSLEITASYGRELAVGRLEREYLRGLRRWFLGFDLFPMPARRFMVDMAYNGGVGLFKKLGMTSLIAERDWLALIKLLPHSTPDRQRWREARLREAATEDGR
jgi:GH24 family phage-related lysozyme (muramidase)